MNHRKLETERLWPAVLLASASIALAWAVIWQQFGRRDGDAAVYPSVYDGTLPVTFGGR